MTTSPVGSTRSSRGDGAARRYPAGAFVGLGLVYGAGAGTVIGLAVAGGPGIALGATMGAALGIVAGAVGEHWRRSSRQPDTPDQQRDQI